MSELTPEDIQQLVNARLREIMDEFGEDAAWFYKLGLLESVELIKHIHASKQSDEDKDRTKRLIEINKYFRGTRHSGGLN